MANSRPIPQRAALEMGPNPLQQAFEDYQFMEAELARARMELQNSIAANGSLLAEIGILREAHQRAESDRVRLQAISSTLLGRLLAINDCIAGAVKASIKDGIEASQEEETIPNDPEPAPDDHRSLIDGAEPAPASPVPSQPKTSVRPPQVDWSRLPHD